jgi:hypothetical protein
VEIGLDALAIGIDAIDLVALVIDLDAAHLPAGSDEFLLQQRLVLPFALGAGVLDRAGAGGEGGAAQPERPRRKGDGKAS